MRHRPPIGGKYRFNNASGCFDGRQPRLRFLNPEQYRRRWWSSCDRAALSKRSASARSFCRTGWNTDSSSLSSRSCWRHCPRPDKSCNRVRSCHRATVILCRAWASKLCPPGPDPAREDILSVLRKNCYHEKFVDLVESDISRNNHIT